MLREGTPAAGEAGGEGYSGLLPRIRARVCAFLHVFVPLCTRVFVVPLLGSICLDVLCGFLFV